MQILWLGNVEGGDEGSCYSSLSSSEIGWAPIGQKSGRNKRISRRGKVRFPIRRVGACIE